MPITDYLTAGNVAWAVAVVTIIFGLMFALSKKKKVMDKSKWLFAAPFLAIGIFVGLMQGGVLTTWGISPFVAAPIVAGADAGIIAGEPCSPQLLALGFVDVTGKCACLNTDGDTTVTLSAIDKYTSVAAGTSHRYRINGGPALTVSNAGTFEASPRDSLEILWGNETDASYYGAVSSVVVPCAGTKTFTEELGQNGTVTVEVYNEEGNKIDASNNETLAAGDVVTLEAKLKGTYQRSSPYGGVITVEMNKTGFDDVIVEFPGGSEVEVPQVYTRTYGADSITKAYSVPAVESNAVIPGKVTIDCDDSTGPVAFDVDRVIIQYRPYDYYIDEDNGGAYAGPAVEDEDDAATFAHVYTTYIYVV